MSLPSGVGRGLLNYSLRAYVRDPAGPRLPATMRTSLWGTVMGVGGGEPGKASERKSVWD